MLAGDAPQAQPPRKDRAEMRTRTLTTASFFSIAMAATLVAALYTTQVRRPEPAAGGQRRARHQPVRLRNDGNARIRQLRA